jgi:hypothetical protein
MLKFELKNNKPNLILFIHGFIGGKNTWIRTDGQKSILEFLKDDSNISNKFDIAVFDYFTKITELFTKVEVFLRRLSFRPKKRKFRNVSIEDISDLLKSEIDHSCREYDNVVIIAHSMGGLIAKSYILKELIDGSGLKVGLYLSLAVPHNGSDLATLAKLIFLNPQIKGLAPLGEEINKMNQSWITVDQLPATVYFQGKNDQIVPKTSSIGYDKRKPNIVFSDDDHSSIVVPKNATHVVIRAIKNFCSGYVDSIDSKIENANKTVNPNVEKNVNELIEEIMIKENIESLPKVSEIYELVDTMKEGTKILRAYFELPVTKRFRIARELHLIEFGEILESNTSDKLSATFLERAYSRNLLKELWSKLFDESIDPNPF